MNIIFSNYDRYKEYVNEQVDKYMREHSDYYGEYKDLVYDNFGFFLIDEDDNISGAIVGRINLNWSHIDVLWTDESVRKQGYATSLIEKATEYAKEKKCIGIRFETFENSVKDFFEYKGFKLAGKIDDLPPGHTEYILVKKI